MRRQRNLRLVSLLSDFLFRPTFPYSLTEYANEFDVSKTIISEDISAISNAIAELGLGSFTVGKGRAGGATFIPRLRKDIREKFLSELAVELSNPDRILPGGLIYYSDLIFQPNIAFKLAYCIASLYANTKVDTVLTSEVKGIPVAIYVAQALGAKLSVCRFRNRASDGAAVAVHFPTSNGDVRTMYMGTRQIEQKSRVLIVDDFLRGGSTITGMLQMAEQFKANVVGVATIIANAKPKLKLRKDCKSLLTLNIDSKGNSKLKVTDNN
ncbi:MAG: phosphoribosyltransferase family protein [Synergistaceae bacterium]|nr:phosphoribosyltransferase family protein [Synergistaceae bacterium]